MVKHLNAKILTCRVFDIVAESHGKKTGFKRFCFCFSFFSHLYNGVSVRSVRHTQVEFLGNGLNLNKIASGT